jgi:hypothetical protein
MPSFLPDGVLSTQLDDSRIVGNPETEFEEMTMEATFENTTSSSRTYRALAAYIAVSRRELLQQIRHLGDPCLSTSVVLLQGGPCASHTPNRLIAYLNRSSAS